MAALPRRLHGTVKQPPTADPLARFSEPTRAWFSEAFAEPTQAQLLGWEAISAGRHTLLHAPTGSGKTLAAFLWCLDRCFSVPRPRPGSQPGVGRKRGATPPGSVRILYISPLKALAYDVERNLRAPLAGIRRTAQRSQVELPEVRVASRTGDTPADARRALAKDPPEILVTTPESLYLLLTSQAREVLRGVEHVIVDEVHALAPTKRGTHLALSLERLETLITAAGHPAPQRIGLSATQRPLSAIAAYLGGVGPDREVTIDCPADLPPVAAEPTYFEQVLTNLLNNAEKYSPPGRPVQVTATHDDGRIAIRVLDRGRGIEPEEAERIFTAFYRSSRTSHEASGAGIGLAVCKRLVEAQGGNVWAAPREDGGTEVGFALRLESDLEP